MLSKTELNSIVIVYVILVLKHNANTTLLVFRPLSVSKRAAGWLEEMGVTKVH
jgi:hypothetical protein